MHNTTYPRTEGLIWCFQSLIYLKRCFPAAHSEETQAKIEAMAAEVHAPSRPLSQLEHEDVVEPGQGLRKHIAYKATPGFW